MDVKATLETRQSKAGNPYDVVVLKLSDKSEKLIFLSPAELELIRIYNSKETNVAPDMSFFNSKDINDLLSK